MIEEKVVNDAAQSGEKGEDEDDHQGDHPRIHFLILL